jgi:dihydropteroate synthase
MHPPASWVCLPDLGDPKRVIGRRTFDFSREIAVMAIVNRTQDSFYDRGETFALDAAVRKTEHALQAGADWIDVGAVPFSPDAGRVSQEEEIERVLPLIEHIRPRTDAVLSVDTFRAEVAERALSAGADVINDTSGLSDPRMADVIATAGGCVVVTHSKAPPKEVLRRPSYHDVVDEVHDYLVQRSNYARLKGVPAEKIIVDPGHDLNKNTHHSLELTRRLNELNGLGYPLLVSVSNKDFIAETLDMPFDGLTAGTVAALVICMLQGARILRVHDVQAAVSAATVVAATLGWRPPLAPRHNLD